MERRLTPTRGKAKVRTDRSVLDDLLDSAHVVHIGLSLPEGPFVVPSSFARDGDRLILHGSTGSPWMRALAEGAHACLTVSEMTGLIVARSAFETGVRYRSAMMFGSCRVLEGQEAQLALGLLTDHYLPGRMAEVRAMKRKEVAATLVLEFPLDQWSVKVADGWSEDEEDDVAGDAWAGVVTMETRYVAQTPAPDLRKGIEVPGSVLRLLEP